MTTSDFPQHDVARLAEHFLKAYAKTFNDLARYDREGWEGFAGKSPQ